MDVSVSFRAESSAVEALWRDNMRIAQAFECRKGLTAVPDQEFRRFAIGNHRAIVRALRNVAWKDELRTARLRIAARIEPNIGLPETLYFLAVGRASIHTAAFMSY